MLIDIISITLEFSFVRGARATSRPDTIAVIQDKFRQKEHFRANGIPVADFMEVRGSASMEEAQQQFGFPLILKRKRLAYDGRGNAVVSSAEDIKGAIERLGGADSNELYVEKVKSSSGLERIRLD